MDKVSEYRDWDIFYSGKPSPLWTATKDMEKDLHSYVSIDAVKQQIDRVEDRKRGLRVR